MSAKCQVALLFEGAVCWIVIENHLTPQHTHAFPTTAMAMWRSSNTDDDGACVSILGIDLDSMMAPMSLRRQLRHIWNNVKIFRKEDKLRLATHAIALALARFEAGDEWEQQERTNALRVAFAEKEFTAEACKVMELLWTKHVECAKVHFERMTWWDSRASSLTKGNSDPHVADRFRARQIMRHVSGATIRALDACLAQARTSRSTAQCKIACP